MDQIDAILVKSLQKDARVPIKALTKTVFLSAPAISSRIEKLEKLGIIKAYRAIIDPKSVGYNIKAYINLELIPDKKNEFYDYVKNCIEVLECDCVTGAYSMLIKAAFPSTNELDEFIGNLQKYGATSTQIVFSTPVEPREIEIENDNKCFKKSCRKK